MVHGANQREPRWFFLWPRTVENASAVPSVLFISTRSRSVNVHTQDRAVQRVQRITTHSGVHIRQRLAWRLAATQKTRSAGKVGGGRIKQAGGEGGGGMDATCGRFRRISVRWLNVNVERVTEVDAIGASLAAHPIPV